MKKQEEGTEMKVLDALAYEELLLYQYVTASTGNAAALNRRFQQEGVFNSYREIFSSYLSLSRLDNLRAVRNEALKRAVFLAWYSDVEPPLFTGLPDLDEDQVLDVYNRLNIVVERNWLSEELKVMLQHYARWEWVILQYSEGKVHALTNWLKEVDPLQETNLGKLEPMENRGLMSLYWKELQQGNSTGR